MIVKIIQMFNLQPNIDDENMLNNVEVHTMSYMNTRGDMTPHAVLKYLCLIFFIIEHSFLHACVQL